MMILRQKALEIAIGYAESKQVYEPTNNNDGEQINKFQHLLGLRLGSAGEKGDPYCVAFAFYYVAKAWCEIHQEDPALWANMEGARDELRYKGILLPTGSCGAMRDWAIGNGCWIPRSALDKVQSGDHVVFEFSPNERHYGVVRDVHDGYVITIEGNTTPASLDSNDPRNGLGGVYQKTRVHSILGFVSIKA
jgi:hypothetical protein